MLNLQLNSKTFILFFKNFFKNQLFFIPCFLIYFTGPSLHLDKRGNLFKDYLKNNYLIRNLNYLNFY